MITAIDTNILLDLLVPNEKFCDASAHALEEAATSRSLVVCDLVCAELCIHFSTQRECDSFLEGNEIRVESLTKDAIFWRAERGDRIGSSVVADVGGFPDRGRSRRHRRHASYPGTAASIESYFRR